MQMKKIISSLLCVGMIWNVYAHGGKEKETASFDVKLAKSKTFKVGEKVQFELEGAPTSLEFYSGESGQEYDLKNGELRPSGMELDFSIRFHLSASSWPVHNPEWGTIPWDKLSLLVSKDFDGDYSFAGVKKATWIDISDRVKFPTVQARTEPAGPINLSDLAEVGKPFYFAFRLKDDHPKRPAFLIQKLTWNTIMPGGKELIGHLKAGDPGEDTINLQQVDEDPKNRAEVKYFEGPKYNDRFTIRRKNSRGSLGKETWLISKKYDGVKEVMGGVSAPVYIKSLADRAVAGHSHIYTAPGTYEACFVTTTLTADGKKQEEVRRITVVVEK